LKAGIKEIEEEMMKRALLAGNRPLVWSAPPVCLAVVGNGLAGICVAEDVAHVFGVEQQFAVFYQRADGMGLEREDCRRNLFLRSHGFTFVFQFMVAAKWAAGFNYRT